MSFPIGCPLNQASRLYINRFRDVQPQKHVNTHSTYPKTNECTHQQTQWIIITLGGGNKLSSSVKIIKVLNSAGRIEFFHFESNRTVELLFEILNRIEQLSLVSKVTSSKYVLNKFNCFYGTALLWL